MWLTLMFTAVFGAFGIGQKWSNENSKRDNEPDPITGQLRVIQESLTSIHNRVEAMEARA